MAKGYHKWQKSVLSVGFRLYTGNQDSNKGELQQAQVVKVGDSLSADVCSPKAIRLIKGDFSEDKNEIVANQTRAEMNQWELGDTKALKWRRGKINAVIFAFTSSGTESADQKHLGCYRIENTIYGINRRWKLAAETKGFGVFAYVKTPEQKPLPVSRAADNIPETGEKVELTKSDAL